MKGPLRGSSWVFGGDCSLVWRAHFKLLLLPAVLAAGLLDQVELLCKHIPTVTVMQLLIHTLPPLLSRRPQASWTRASYCASTSPARPR